MSITIVRDKRFSCRALLDRRHSGANAEIQALTWRNRVVGRQCEDEVSANDHAQVVGGVSEFSGARGDALGVGHCVLRCAFVFSAAARARGWAEPDSAVDAVRAGCMA